MVPTETADGFITLINECLLFQFYMSNDRSRHVTATNSSLDFDFTTA